MEITVKNASELFETKISIPAIQRDFAMGRSDSHAKETRRLFIKDLFNAAFNDEVLDLDFVYGLDQSGVFLPLDGQQRLTMLFLFAWFCGVDAIRSWHFDYESRRCVEQFMDSLKKHSRHTLAEDGKTISESIKKASFFYPAWETDPNIKGMLRVLDDMSEEFKRLSYNTHNKPTLSNIRFCWNTIANQAFYGEYGNIFLKMNSRGLPLSSWENLKAILDSQASNIQDLKWGETIQLFQERMWKLISPCYNSRAFPVRDLDMAMEKVTRIFASSYLYNANSAEVYYEKSAFVLGETICDNPDFFFEFKSFVESIQDGEQIKAIWSNNRKDNALWNSEPKNPNNEFINWIREKRNPSMHEQLKLIFLSSILQCVDLNNNSSPLNRRARVLLNLLDNTDVSPEKYHRLKSVGLAFIKYGEWPNDNDGFNKKQLFDEYFKRRLDSDIVMDMEKSDLVWMGSLCFLHPDFYYFALPDESEQIRFDPSIVLNRLDRIRTFIDDSEKNVDFYITILKSFNGENNYISERVCIPRDNHFLWAREMFSNSKNQIHKALELVYVNEQLTSENNSDLPVWIKHLKIMLERFQSDNGFMNVKYIKKPQWVDWNYCIKDQRLSDYSIRLARSEEELYNIVCLKKGNPPYFFKYETEIDKGYYRNEDGTYYQIAGIGSDAWWTCKNPQPFIKKNDEFVEFDKQ